MHFLPDQCGATLICSEQKVNFTPFERIKELLPNDVFIVLVETDLLLNQVNNYIPYLTDLEIDAIQRLHKQQDRKRKIISKAILKQLIAQFIAIDVKKIIIAKTSSGKPYLVNNPHPPLYFNSSDSDDLVLLAFSRTEIGVDIEYKCNKLLMDEISSTNFTRQEQMQLQLAPDPLDYFYTIWTRKEAILKAAGTGVNDYLNELSVANGVNPVSLSVLPLKGNWYVHSFNISPLAKAAVAVPQSSQQLQFFNYLAANFSAPSV